jgi:hypothetical protein
MEGGSVGHNFERDPARFGLIWFRGFRGEDLNVKVYDVRRRSSHGLWPGELKIGQSETRIACGGHVY